jgi:ligand-binding sensor domain-containing protein
LRQYTLGGNSRGSYVIPGTPSTQAVRPMDVGRDGTLWLGTSSGARAYHPGGRVDDFTTANSPLANDDVHSIRVDRVTGAVWMATGGGISRFDPYYVPPEPERSELSFAVYPNPARVTAVGLPIRLSGNASSYHGVIYDLNGRRVRTFSASANGRVVWDCRDEHGDIVRPGIYFVRAESGGLSGVERIVLLH